MTARTHRLTGRVFVFTNASVTWLAFRQYTGRLVAPTYMSEKPAAAAVSA